MRALLEERRRTQVLGTGTLVASPTAGHSASSSFLAGVRRFSFLLCVACGPVATVCRDEAGNCPTQHAVRYTAMSTQHSIARPSTQISFALLFAPHHILTLSTLQDTKIKPGIEALLQVESAPARDSDDADKMSLPAFPEAVFWFALLGASAASAKHLFKPVATVGDLTPIALRMVDGKPGLSPEAAFWGGWAFSALNAGFATVGLWAALTRSTEAKQGFLLGTGTLFAAFAAAWLRVGATLTGKRNFKRHAAKIAAFSALFLGSFAISLL